MTKILVEICMISARELNSSSLWKLQWFVVGWTDPNNKYCSKITTCAGSTSNPTWKTKFSFYFDDSEDDLQRLGLTIEVHNREPLFLREKIHGIVYIPLKQFLLNYYSNYPNGFEEGGRFQLQAKNSGKPRGFVDISVKIMEVNLNPDRATALNSESQRSRKTLDIEDGQSLEYHRTVPPSSTMPSYSSHHHQPRQSRPLKHGIRTRSRHCSSSSTQLGHNMTSYFNTNDDHRPNYYQNSPESTIEFEHDDHRRRQRTPSPPPPPSNIGFIPTFFPETGQVPDVDMPSGRGSTRRRSGISASFGTGVGAGGALAAGAVIFGDDFM